MLESKKRSSIVLWVLLVLIVIGGYVAYREFTTTDEHKATDTETIKGENAAVTDYLQFINSGKEMGLDHEFTNGALTRLIKAINSKAEDADYSVTTDLEKVKEHAEQITKDPFETTHANSIRKAANILTDVMQNMQKAKYPDLTAQADGVRTAANSINPDVLTLDQRDAVKSFFQKSADLLQNMN